MTEVFADVDYGGRVTDDRDKRTLSASLSPLLHLALDRPLASQAPSAEATAAVRQHPSLLQRMMAGEQSWTMQCFSPPFLDAEDPLAVRIPARRQCNQFPLVPT
jgi:hypothetical protein